MTLCNGGAAAEEVALYFIGHLDFIAFFLRLKFLEIEMDLPLSLLLFLASMPTILAQDTVLARILIHGTAEVVETDDYFVCATIDWWPHYKCNYNQCPWGYTSALNLNLTHPHLIKAVQAFKPLRIRVGGSLQDKVIYDVGSLKSPCTPFQRMRSWLFGFSKGCLHMRRWDDLNRFFSQTGAIVTFGLNALYGRRHSTGTIWEGDWDYSNAMDFIKYTISKGYKIDSWEFGNELSGTGVGASVNAGQYGKDLIKLGSIIRELYNNSHPKPLLIAPGGFYDKAWFAQLLQASGPRVVNIVSHHIYNLGAGADPDLVNKILNPWYLSKIVETFSSLDQTIRNHGPWASAWIGEAGGAYNSGGRLVSNTFVNSFWYLDQLGLASKYRTKVYCRQTLIGGNYGLLDSNTFLPNPDFYSALLWHRLMGKRVLTVNTDASPFLRAYAHCSKGRAGVTLLLINLSRKTTITIQVQTGLSSDLSVEESGSESKSCWTQRAKRSVKWVGTKASTSAAAATSTSTAATSREEYHLTPTSGHVQSQTMNLNGIPLEITRDGEIPKMEPLLKNTRFPIQISPLSILFTVLPNFDAPTCN